MGGMTSIWPPAYDTAIGQVRSLVPDVELLENPQDLSEEPSYLFEDKHLQSYLVMARDNVYRAAAIAVNTLASSEILILKNLRSDDRVTQGDKVGDALGRRAEWLLEMAEAEDNEALYEGFEIVYPRYLPEDWEIR